MGKIEIHGLRASPPTRSVVIICELSGIPYEFIELDPLDKGPEFQKLSPQQQIPVLVEDGFALAESRAIIKYLLGKYAKDDSLYPKDLKARAVVDSRLDFDNGYLWPKLIDYFKPTMTGNKPDEEKIKNLLNASSIVEDFLTRDKWIAGSAMTVADVFSASTMSTVTKNANDIIDFSPYPKIKAWIEECRKLEIFKKYDDEGDQLVKERVVMLLEKIKQQ